MCQSAKVNGSYTGNVRELAQLIGCKPEELVWHDNNPDDLGIDYKFCLCPIDLERTATKFDYKAEVTDFGDWNLTK